LCADGSENESKTTLFLSRKRQLSLYLLKIKEILSYKNATVLETLGAVGFQN